MERIVLMAVLMDGIALKLTDSIMNFHSALHGGELQYCDRSAKTRICRSVDGWGGLRFTQCSIIRMSSNIICRWSNVLTSDVYSDIVEGDLSSSSLKDKTIFISYGAYDFVIPSSTRFGSVLDTMKAFSRAGILYTNLVIGGAGHQWGYLARWTYICR